MIHYFTPFAIDKNLGKSYNHYASLVKDEDWICFKDRDVFFLTHDYGRIIKENIDLHKDISLFTCLTNRVGNKKQCFNGNISDDPDIRNHYEISLTASQEKRHDVILTDWVISGHVMIIQKKTWNKIGGAKDGLLGVDNYISKQILNHKMKIGILQGLYVFHFYRFNSTVENTAHLK